MDLLEALLHADDAAMCARLRASASDAPSPANVHVLEPAVRSHPAPERPPNAARGRELHAATLFAWGIVD